MSEVLQSGYHPDADQISAFVEHALPAHEREQMLDHLAVCQECRATVALSFRSIEPAKNLIATARKPRWLREPLWSRWTLAWPALAITAALAVFVIYVHHAKSNPTTEAPPQEARLHQTAPLEMPKTAPAPAPESPAPQPTRDVRPSAMATGRGALSLSRKDDLRTTATNSSKPQLDTNLASTLVNSEETASIKANKESAPTAQLDSNAASTLITSQEINQLATQSRNISSLAALAPGASDNKTVTSANPAKSTPSGDAIATTASSSVASSNREQEFQSQHLKHRLPSHLPVLSMVVHDRRIIAIDMRYTVFLSADAGKHWKPIRAPWTGRPVLVELASAETIVGKPAAPASPAQEHSVLSARIAVPGPAQAQVANPAPTGKQDSILTGIVTDLTGAVVAGAAIHLMNPETGVAGETVSGPSGLYDLDGLSPGIYNLKVTAKGFETNVQTGILVNAHATARVDVKLMLGQETETISVVADTLAVQSDSNVVSTLIKTDEPAPVFEITTDNLDHWTSTDGITWKRK
jgi:hypothetical protein